MNLDTSNRTYRQLMGNGLIYSVPRFQRDYSWTSNEWDDLWLDVLSLFVEEGEDEHYMGYLVLQTNDSKRFDIIDGQQRLTTLSVLVLAVLGNFQKLINNGIETDRNQARMEQLRSSFIGYLDPVTLVPQSKLNLNRNNNNLYQRYLVPLEPAPRRNLKATEHLLRKAYNWFYEAIKNHFKENLSGENLARFIDELSDKLFFTVITVGDELNAYKVFETLNARGVKLSSTDLLKNYLFSVVHNQDSDLHEMNILDEQWDSLVGAIGNGSLPDFLRTYWNSKNKLVRHSELFKRVRNKISSKQQVFSLMRDLERNTDVFAALPKADDSLWLSDQKKYIRTLKLFQVKQHYSLMLAAYTKFSEDEFTTLLKACMVISLRYNIIGSLTANEQERVYNRVAVMLSNNAITTLQEVLRELNPIYVPDNKFRNDFETIEFNTKNSRYKKIVRYILFTLEKHLSGNDYDQDSDLYNIEHIMPESPGEHWQHIEDKDHQNFVYQLGNLTILNRNANREIGNSGFEAKKASYRESDFSITRSVAEENADWNVSRIAARQKQMARQAVTIWRISQLD